MTVLVNRTLRIVTVLGARPQFIKASVVSSAIQCHNDRCTGQKIEEEIVHTGQHYDYGMVLGFLRENANSQSDHQSEY